MMAQGEFARTSMPTPSFAFSSAIAQQPLRDYQARISEAALQGLKGSPLSVQARGLCGAVTV